MGLFGRFIGGDLPRLVPPMRSTSKGHVVMLISSGSSKLTTGVQGQALARAKYLAEAGWEVTIIARGNPDWNGIHFVDSIRVIALRPRDLKLGHWIEKQWFHPFLNVSVEQILPKLMATIPMSHILILDSQVGIPAIKFARQHGVPTMFLVNGTALDPVALPSLLRKLSLKWERYCYNQATSVAPVSTAILKTYERAFGNRSKVKVLPNAVSRAFVGVERPISLVSNFMFVGRLEPDKRPVNAVNSILESPDTYLRVIGDGSLKSTLRQKCMDLERVWLSDGHVSDREELISHYAWGQCFLWVSAAESFGVAPLEAMASGQIVIAPLIPAAIEMLGEDYELLVPVDDVVGLVNAIKRVQTDAELVQRCRQRCRVVVDKYKDTVVFGELEFEMLSQDSELPRYLA